MRKRKAPDSTTIELDQEPLLKKICMGLLKLTDDLDTVENIVENDENDVEMKIQKSENRHEMFLSLLVPGPEMEEKMREFKNSSFEKRMQLLANDSTLCAPGAGKILTIVVPGLLYWPNFLNQDNLYHWMCVIDKSIENNDKSKHVTLIVNQFHRHYGHVKTLCALFKILSFCKDQLSDYLGIDALIAQYISSYPGQEEFGTPIICLEQEIRRMADLRVGFFPR